MMKAVWEWLVMAAAFVVAVAIPLGLMFAAIYLASLACRLGSAP